MQVLPTSGDLSYSGHAHLYFADAGRGWLVLRHESSSNFSQGDLYTTSDGGATWSKVPGLPHGDPVYFNPYNKNGWQVGGPQFDKLYRTKDDGRSWQVQTVKLSEGIEYAAFGLPKFQNEREGILPVTVIGKVSGLALYRTSDGGDNWQFANMLPASSDEISIVTQLPVAIAQNQVVAAANGKAADLQDVTGTRNQPVSLAVAKETIVKAISFSAPDTGWVLTAAYDCQGFKQGCEEKLNLWRINPDGKPATDLTDRLPPNLNSGQGQPDINAVTTSSMQGIDACMPFSTSNLQNWWNNSPYYNVNIYFGGRNRGCKTANESTLTPTWITAAFNQGWGLIPTWVGYQAACTPYNYWVMSADPNEAYAQGKAEANEAADKAALLGFAPDTIIYYDMEAYPYTNAGCREAVKAFLNGWVEQIHARGNKAGIYGSSGGSAAIDWHTLPNPPDGVWLAHYIRDTYDPNATVWDVYNIPNSLWVNKQRIRQYAGGHQECYGGYCHNVDNNALDGLVARPGGTVGGVQFRRYDLARLAWDSLNVR